MRHRTNRETLDECKTNTVRSLFDALNENRMIDATVFSTKTVQGGYRFEIESR